jgi:hypothetical protein
LSPSSTFSLFFQILEKNLAKIKKPARTADIQSDTSKSKPTPLGTGNVKWYPILRLVFIDFNFCPVMKMMGYDFRHQKRNFMRSIEFTGLFPALAAKLEIRYS